MSGTGLSQKTNITVSIEHLSIIDKIKVFEGLAILLIDDVSNLKNLGVNQEAEVFYETWLKVEEKMLRLERKIQSQKL